MPRGVKGGIQEAAMGVRSYILRVGPSPLGSAFEAGPGGGPPCNPPAPGHSCMRSRTELDPTSQSKPGRACWLVGALWGPPGFRTAAISAPGTKPGPEGKVPSARLSCLAGLGEASPRR